MSTSILATKLYIPPSRSNVVLRPRLIKLLNAGLTAGKRLTIISAPAGYGKSTLLGEWQAQADIPVAWLSLERGENTPARFWSYFVAALNTLPQVRQVNLGDAILRAIRNPQPGSMEAQLTELINQLSALEEPVCLVLDDLHTLSESQIHQDLIYLIEHLPHSAPGLHLMVTSRMDPPWPLARWRASGEMNELRAIDLRFSYEETSQFLQEALHLDLAPQEIVALQTRTEGWVAGLQMAVISMQGRLKTHGQDGVSSFIDAFSGSNRFILDYLLDEVLIQQSKEIQAFLFETSILDKLTAHLCDALTEKSGSQTVLDQLEHANLFLIPLDEERRWYRYHYLFAEFLQKELKQRQPGHIPQLHRRASAWYAANNMPSEAVHHSLAAKDIARVNQILAGNALIMVDHVELWEVLRHFKELPADEIASNPWLCMAYAWAKAYADPSDGMQEVLRQVEHSLKYVEKEAEKEKMSSYLAAIQAYLAWMRGDGDQALEYAQRALDRSLDEDWAVRTHLLNIQGLAWQYQGDLVAATQSFDAALACAEKSGRIHEVRYTTSNLAFVHLLQSHLHEAFSLCQIASGRVKGSSESLEWMPVLAYALSTKSIILLEWNELESAVAAARQGVALAEQWRQADASHFALTCLSQALGSSGALEEAFAVNQRAMRLAKYFSPWYARISTENEIMLLLAKRDILAAAKKFEEYELIVKGSKIRRPVFIEVSLRFAQNRYSDVINTLDETLGDIKQKDGHRTWLKALLIRALALQALGRQEEALEVLDQRLTAAEPEGYVRIFVGRGAPMTLLLQIAKGRGIYPEYISKLLAAFGIPEETPASKEPIAAARGLPVANLIEPLSARELEVLRFLNSHLTVPEIANEMLIAPSTLRSHVRSIYLKLDVHGRLEALQKARDLGLF